MRHTATTADLLTGVHLLETERTPLPTRYGSWDPALVRLDDAWHVAFVESPSQDPFDFHPALARTTAATWHEGLEPVAVAGHLHHCEGPVFVKVDGRTWLLTSDGEARRYPMFDLDAPRAVPIPPPPGARRGRRRGAPGLAVAGEQQVPPSPSRRPVPRSGAGRRQPRPARAPRARSQRWCASGRGGSRRGPPRGTPRRDVPGASSHTSAGSHEPPGRQRRGSVSSRCTPVSRSAMVAGCRTWITRREVARELVATAAAPRRGELSGVVAEHPAVAGGEEPGLDRRSRGPPGGSTDPSVRLTEGPKAGRRPRQPQPPVALVRGAVGVLHKPRVRGRPYRRRPRGRVVHPRHPT